MAKVESSDEKDMGQVVVTLAGTWLANPEGTSMR